MSICRVCIRSKVSLFFFPGHHVCLSRRSSTAPFFLQVIDAVLRSRCLPFFILTYDPLDGSKQRATSLWFKHTYAVENEKLPFFLLSLLQMKICWAIFPSRLPSWGRQNRHEPSTSVHKKNKHRFCGRTSPRAEESWLFNFSSWVGRERVEGGNMGKKSQQFSSWESCR